MRFIVYANWQAPQSNAVSPQASQPTSLNNFQRKTILEACYSSFFFFLPLFLLFIFSFVVSENTESTKYIPDGGRCETKRCAANCRAGKVGSSLCACQDRTNFSLYSCSFISVDTQFTASQALRFCLISLLPARHPAVAGWL